MNSEALRVVPGSPDLAMRKPARLEALPVPAPLAERKRKTVAGDLHTFELI